MSMDVTLPWWELLLCTVQIQALF